MWKFWVEMGWKCRIRLCQNLKFRFFQNLDSGKWNIGTSKPKFSFLKNLGFRKVRNRDLKICNSFCFSFFGTSKPKIRFRFWILGPWIRFRKFENRFLQFLSNLISRHQNLKSATSKTPKSWFSLQNSNFSSTKILILY